MTIRVKTLHGSETGLADNLHPALAVTMPDGSVTRCCGYSWCTGECGLPAAVITSPKGIEHKLFSSMVAHGPMVQRFRDPWQGERFVISSEHWEELSAKWWL